MTRHVLGLFQGQHGGKRFRRYISEHASRRGADIGVLLTALATVEQPNPSLETDPTC